MKLILSLMFVLGIFLPTHTDSDTEIKIKILQAVFKNSTLIEYEGEKILETKVRERFATIPIVDSKCRLLKFQNNIVALVFNIYLSDNELHYKKMKNAGLNNFMDLDNGSELKSLTENERLIQVLFYDLAKNKFLAKSNGFPIEGLPWLPTGLGDMTQIIVISDFKLINKSKFSCYLSLTECPDCNNSIYCFKYREGKVLASKKYSGCYQSIVETGRKILGKEITNCYEHNIDDEPATYEIVTLLKW